MSETYLLYIFIYILIQCYIKHRDPLSCFPTTRPLTCESRWPGAHCCWQPGRYWVTGIEWGQCSDTSRGSGNTVPPGKHTKNYGIIHHFNR